MSAAPPRALLPSASGGARSSPIGSQGGVDANCTLAVGGTGADVAPSEGATGRATTPIARDRRPVPRTKRRPRARRATIAPSAPARTRARGPPSSAARCARAATTAAAADSGAVQAARLRPRGRRPTVHRAATPPLRAVRGSDRCGRRFRLEHVFVRQRDQRRHRLARGMRRVTAPSVANCVSRSSQAPRACHSADDSARSPGQPAAASHCARIRSIHEVCRSRACADPRAPLASGPRARDRRRTVRRSRRRARRRAALRGATRLRVAPGAASRRAPPRRTASAAAPPRGPWAAARARARSGRGPRRGSARRRPRRQATGCTDATASSRPGHCSDGQRMSSASARTSSRRDAKSSMAMPIVASGSASARSRAQRSARAISSRGVAPTARRNGPAESRTVAQCPTSIPAAASAARSRCCCGESSTNPASVTDAPRQMRAAEAPRTSQSGNCAGSIAPPAVRIPAKSSAQRANAAQSSSPPAHARQLRPPAPHAWTNDQASAASVAAPCSSISDKPSEATIRFHRYAPCADGQEPWRRDWIVRGEDIEPQALEPAAPRHDVGRRPDGATGGTLRVVVERGEPARQALVRRDDRRARGERRAQR